MGGEVSLVDATLEATAKLPFGSMTVLGSHFNSSIYCEYACGLKCSPALPLSQNTNFAIASIQRIYSKENIMKKSVLNIIFNIVTFCGLLGVVLFGLVGLTWAAPDHSLWGELLAKYNQAGHVNYAGFKSEEASLDAYLGQLSKIDPESLSSSDRFAFYVNAYNAWTIKLILSSYPGLKSIKDLGNLFKSPWKRKFVDLNGKKVSLDYIEHDILRPQFQDPRVHFAVNCASLGCPPLFKEPFIGSRLDQQLNTATTAFINDNRYNRLEGNTLYVSMIFKWFKEDFNNDIIAFFEQFAADELKSSIKNRRATLQVKYLDYDWGLNGI